MQIITATKLNLKSLVTQAPPNLNGRNALVVREFRPEPGFVHLILSDGTTVNLWRIQGYRAEGDGLGCYEGATRLAKFMLYVRDSDNDKQGTRMKDRLLVAEARTNWKFETVNSGQGCGPLAATLHTWVTNPANTSSIDN